MIHKFMTCLPFKTNCLEEARIFLFFFKKVSKQPDTVTHSCNPNTWKVKGEVIVNLSYTVNLRPP